MQIVLLTFNHSPEPRAKHEERRGVSGRLLSTFARKRKRKKDKFIEIPIVGCCQPLQRKENKRDKIIAVNLNQKEKKDKFIETQFCNAHLGCVTRKRGQEKDIIQ